MKQKAFTIIELLLAIGIVGAIAALTVPNILDNINKRTLTNQLKNIVSEFEYLINEELLNNNTKNIADTNFNKPNYLLGRFEKSLSCTQTNANCWAASYKKLNAPGNADLEINNENSIKLKNGASLYYEYIPEMGIGVVFIDVNGNDAPNIVGRDAFAFFVYESGVTDISGSSKSDLKSDCQDGAPDACFWYLLKNKWEMDY